MADDVDDECPHGLGMRAACVICNGRVERERAAAEAAVRTVLYAFAARYAGHCATCSGPIAVGDPVVMRGDHRTAHQECP